MKTKRLAVLIITLLIASTFLGLVPVSAESNYSYYLPNSNGYGYYIPLAYETERTITYIEEMDQQLLSPQDMFLTKEYLYILDSDNARVVVLTHTGEYVTEYSGEYGTMSNEEADILVAKETIKFFKCVWKDKENKVIREEDYVLDEENRTAIPESKLPENLKKNPNINDGLTETKVLRDGMENGDYVHITRVIDYLSSNQRLVPTITSCKHHHHNNTINNKM